MSWGKVVKIAVLASMAVMPPHNGTMCGDEQRADTLTACDSALSAILTQQILVGNRDYPKSQRVDMILLGKPTPVTLFMENDGVWHEPIFCAKRAFWRPTGDSVFIAAHRRVNLEDYLFPNRHGGELNKIYEGVTANIIWNPVPDSFRTEEIILDTVIFPRDTYFYWDWGGEKVEAGFMYLGSALAPLFYAVMGLTGPDDESYTHWANEGLWHRYGDQYVPLGFLELSRK